VKNHLNSPKLSDLMETDLFIYHGYVALWLKGRMFKVTPAFNTELCQRFRRQGTDLRRRARCAVSRIRHQRPTPYGIRQRSRLVCRSANRATAQGVSRDLSQADGGERQPRLHQRSRFQRNPMTSRRARAVNLFAAAWRIAPRSGRPSRVQSPASGFARCRHRFAGPSHRGSADGTAGRWCNRNARGSTGIDG
jgi:hypothetical protein